MELRIDGWRAGIRFAASHILPGHPKCGRLHGHTYALHLALFGEPDARGFLLDFAEVKEGLQKIAERLDHRFLFAEKGDYQKYGRTATEVTFTFGGKSYALPASDVEALPIAASTAESLATYALDLFLASVKLPRNVERVEVGVDEGYGKGARASRTVGRA